MNSGRMDNSLVRDLRSEAGPERFGGINLSFQGPGIDGLKPRADPVEKVLEQADLPGPQLGQLIIVVPAERGLGMTDNVKISQLIHR